MKKVAILYSKHIPVVDAIKYNLSDCIVDCITEVCDMEKYDLVINLCPDKYDTESIACHHSLLPAFNCDEPEKEAVLAGVKVTGITVYYTKTGKIITQYPIFIKTDMHYDEVKKELDYLEQTILPLTAKKLIQNEPFDINSILTKGCNGNCGGCSSCSH